MAKVLSETGTLITGDHTKSFTATSACQYFLVANPYASPVNPAFFTDGANRTKLDNVLYMWDAKQGGSRGLGRYDSYDIDAASYSNGGGGTVEPGEAIRMNHYPNPVVPGISVRLDLEAKRAP